MDLNSLALFRLMQEKLAWLTQRQSVLAQNIANVDTPGYKPNYLKPFDFNSVLGEFRQLPMRTDDPVHLVGRRADAGTRRPARERNPYETVPSGNSVSLEEQMMKVADTAGQYQLITNLYRKQIGMIKTALGRAS